jgi:hypothetical protein
MLRIATMLGALLFAVAAITALPACDDGAAEGEGEGE